MPEQLTPLQSFQEKVRDRIVKDFTELIPQDAVDEMVKRAIDEAFFKERRVEESTGYYKNTVTKQPLLVEMAEKEARAVFEKAVKEWIAANEETVMQALRSVFEQSAGDVLLKAFGAIFSQTVNQVQAGLVVQVQEIVNLNDLKVQPKY